MMILRVRRLHSIFCKYNPIFRYFFLVIRRTIINEIHKQYSSSSISFEKLCKLFVILDIKYSQQFPVCSRNHNLVIISPINNDFFRIRHCINTVFKGYVYNRTMRYCCNVVEKQKKIESSLSDSREFFSGLVTYRKIIYCYVLTM